MTCEQKIPNTKRANGFTLIETGIVILIMSILTGVYLIGTNSSVNNGNSAGLKTHILKLVDVAHGYAAANAGNPSGNYYGLPSGSSTVNSVGSTSNPYLPTPWPSQNPFGGIGYFLVPSANYFEVVETGNFSAAVATAICGALAAHEYSGGTNSCAAGSITLSFQ